MRRVEKIAFTRNLLIKNKTVHFEELYRSQNWSRATCYRIAEDMLLLYNDLYFEEYTIKLLPVSSRPKF